ncbi:hypothetical protein pb186bvf_015181 [Paramecium bursaria]
MILIKAMQNLRQKPVEPPRVDPNLIYSILQIEEIFHEGNYNLNHVNQLLQLYSQLVEYFDNSNSAIRTYFLEKMQFLVTRPQTIKLMAQGDQDDMIRYTQFRTSFRQIKQEEENRFNRPFLATQQIEEKPKMRFSIQKSKEQRALQMQINIQIEENRPEAKKDLKQLIKEYEQTSREYDITIRQQLNEQNDQLKKRVQQRSKNRERSSSQVFQKIEPLSNSQFNRLKLINQIEESMNFMRLSIQKQKR